MKGIVDDIQYQLKGNNRHDLKTYKGKVDGKKGPLTNAAIKKAKLRLGYPSSMIDARLDGGRGRKLRSYLLPFKNSKGDRNPDARQLPESYRKRARARAEAIREARRERADAGGRILRVAAGEIGTRESPYGSNRGTRVCYYQSFDFLSGCGYAWCVSFCQSSYARAGFPIPYRTAHSGALLNWARSVGWASSTPVRGCVVVFDWNGNSAANGGGDHGAIVESFTSNRVNTIDGNVGQMVQRQSRPRDWQVLGYVVHPKLRQRRAADLELNTLFDNVVEPPHAEENGLLIPSVETITIPQFEIPSGTEDAVFPVEVDRPRAMEMLIEDEILLDLLDDDDYDDYNPEFV